MITDKTLEKLSKKPSLSKDKAFCLELAAELHTFYIDDSVNIFEKQLMNAIGKSRLNPAIILMPKQLEALHFIQRNEKCVLSASTSFGKSFLIMEYIKRLENKLHLIVYVVHTVSLHQEVFGNYSKYFEGEYNVVDNLLDVDEKLNNIVVIISDGDNVFSLSAKIDLLIIDEAYNLGDEKLDNRYLNVYSNCVHLIELSQRNILIGPFIKGVESNNPNIDASSYKLFSTDYSPVTALLLEGDKLPSDDCSKLFINLVKKGENTIFFINSKTYIYSQINDLLNSNELVDMNEEDPFIKWLESYFPSYWLLPKILKKGIALYHSSFPEYIKRYCMEKFNSKAFKGILTTSSILEGINTSAQNVIVNDDQNTANTLSSFRFFNLCGRAGRLNKDGVMGTIYNYSSPYSQRYEERSLTLMIGLEAKDEIDAFNKGLNTGDELSIVMDVKNELNSINIDFNKWYKENKSFFFGNILNLYSLLNIYKVFKVDFKEKMKIDYIKKFDENEKLVIEGLKKPGKPELNKVITLKYIYDSFIVPSKRRAAIYTHMEVPFVINDIITSSYGGLSLDIKSLLENTSTGRYINSKEDIIEKNSMFSDLLKIAFGYIRYDYFYTNYLLNEFIQNDNYFNQEEKNMFDSFYFSRIKKFLGENEEGRLGTMLVEKGVIPPLIKRIKEHLKTKLGDKIETMTKKQLLMEVGEIFKSSDFVLDDYEFINLQSVGLIKP